MKIDYAIREFIEKVDEEAMAYIDRLSNNVGLNGNRAIIKLFNITEAFNTFNSYIKGYGEYKILNADNKEASTQEAISESVDTVINTKLIKESEYKYRDIPKFIKGYTNGIEELQESVDQVKTRMIVEGIAPEYVGDVSEFTDKFITKISESFYEALDRILGESGYKAHKAINASHYTPKETPQMNVFL